MAAQTMDQSVDERLQSGIAYKIDGQYEDAERMFRAILDEHPDHAGARHQMGLVFNFTGMFDESIEELRRAVELDESLLNARVDLALVYMMLGMNEEALAELEIVLAKEPNHAGALRHIVYLR